MRVQIPGPPVPTARARRGRGGHWYTPQRTADAEKAVADACKAVMRGRTYRGPVALAIVFWRPDRRRLDLDNLTKTVMDGATNGDVWDDDSQVVAQVAIVELDAESPRTEIAMCSVESRLREVG